MRRDISGIIGGTALIAFGMSAVIASVGYGVGSASEMGAGFFPLVVGGAIAFFGLAILVPAFWQPGDIPAPSWRSAIGILASVAGFALTVESLGLLPAVATAVVLAALADRDSKSLQVILLSVCLALGSWLIFIKGLGLPMSAFRYPF